MRRFGNVLVAIVLGVALFTACKGGKQQGSATEYPVMVIKTVDVDMATSYSATIIGHNDIAVYPQVSGTITEVKIHEGMQVKEGQVLFIIDQVPYQAAYDQAVANYEAAKVAVATAQLNYDSEVKLYESNVVSEFDLMQSLNSLNSAKATLAQCDAAVVNAENNLSYTEVKSPRTGVTGTVPYWEGTLVSPSMAQPLTNVSENDGMYVLFSLNETAALDLAMSYGSMDAAIQKMPDLYLKLSNGQIYSHPGRVVSVSGLVNASTGAVQVKADFPNQERFLMSGANASILFPDLYRDVIMIPQEAASQLQDKYFVYKVVDGVTKSTQIEVLAKNDGKNFIVTSGLEVGDKIVSQGAGLLRSNLQVKERIVDPYPDTDEDTQAESTETVEE